jgi:copper chaperone CopZ
VLVGVPPLPPTSAVIRQRRFYRIGQRSTSAELATPGCLASRAWHIRCNAAAETAQRLSRRTIMKRIIVTLTVFATVGLSGYAYGKTVTHTWHVSGITSAHDEQKVENAISSLPGVENATTRERSVTITYDNRKVSMAKVRRAIKSAGAYRLGSPLRPHERHAQASMQH